MTDPALAFGTTLSMAGFWSRSRARTPPPRGRLRVLRGLAVGLLAKGPVARRARRRADRRLDAVDASWRARGRGCRGSTGTLLPRRWPCRGTGRRSALARLPRLFPRRRALEALRRARLEGRSLRRRARPAARNDLAVLDRRGAALVDRRAGLARPRAARRRATCARSSRDPWRVYLLLWTVAPMLFFTFVRQHPRDLRAARAAGVRAAGGRNLAARAAAARTWRAAARACTAGRSAASAAAASSSAPSSSCTATLDDERSQRRSSALHDARRRRSRASSTSRQRPHVGRVLRARQRVKVADARRCAALSTTRRPTSRDPRTDLPHLGRATAPARA